MNVFIPRAVDELATAFDRLRTAEVIGCDTETSGLDPRTGRLFSVQFSDGEFNVLVPSSEGVSLGPLSGILVDENITKVFHNARFDIEYLAEAGYQTNNVFDTMVAEKVLTRGAGQSSSLAETLYRHFAVDLDKSQRAKFGRKWDGNWTPALIDYALSDVVYLPELMRVQIDWLKKLGLESEFERQMSRISRRPQAGESTKDADEPAP